MVLEKPERLVAHDLEVPSATDTDQTLVRITHSGVCGTDLKIFDGGIPVEYPRIMGHEMIGEVVDPAGADVRRGQRVIIDPVTYCGDCFHCNGGQEHLCPGGHVLGRDLDGGFAEFFLAPSEAIFPLPDSISSQSAPLIQVMTTCLHGSNLIDIGTDDTVVVIGLGVTGQFHVQIAKARGARQVIGVTRSAARRALAEELGADVTLAPDDQARAKIQELTDGRGADLVIESVGNVAVLAEAVEIARIGGTLLLFGIYTARELELPLYQLYFKELAIINARAAKREDYPACIALVGEGAVKLDPMVSHVLPLDDLAKAITMLGMRDEARMKVILDHTN